MDDRVRQEVRIERIDSGSEEAVIAQALDRVEPGDLVVYHRGSTGSAPSTVKRAAMLLHDRGLCLLTQRITAERNGDGERIVDYLAIKTRGKP
jgi:hypothetical protein